MIIKELNIKNFGKLHDRRIVLSSGINVIYGANESGKTTLHTFLRSMFFGMTRQRGRASRHDTYSRYEPWNGAGSYGGSLWFQCQGRNFRLSRSFQKGNASVELICEDDGEILSVEQGDLDALLGNISEAVYENTVSIAQMKSATDQGLVQELQNYMASYQGSADSAIDLNRAMQALKMWRKGYQVQEEKYQALEKTRREKLSVKMEYLQRDLERLKEQEIHLAGQGACVPSDLPEESGRTQEEEKEPYTIYDRRNKSLQKKKVLCIFLSLVFLGAGALGVWLLPVLWGKAAAGIGCAFVDFFIAYGITRLSREQDRNRRRKARKLQRQEKLQWNMENLQEEIREKELLQENLREDWIEYEEGPEEIPGHQEVEALNMAMHTISRISADMHQRLGENLRSRTSRILWEITEGRYTQVHMDENLAITVLTKERTIPLERLSRGTVEQIYFALRMAVGDILCKEEELPIILDDVFAMYDEERLRAVLQWLKKTRRQVIITSCHTRELEVLEAMGLPFTAYEL